MDKYTATEIAYKNGYAKGYADGVKEFAERLKGWTHDICPYGEVVRVERIDKLEEEMVGADNV